VASVSKTTSQLQALFPSFYTFPMGVQEALVDISYNVGKAGFDKFINLAKAVKEKNWDKAALESRRRPDSSGVYPRNTLVFCAFCSMTYSKSKETKILTPSLDTQPQDNAKENTENFYSFFSRKVRERGLISIEHLKEKLKKYDAKSPFFQTLKALDQDYLDYKKRQK
jgi:hypothetical protein